jgi:hypothetical protein
VRIIVEATFQHDLQLTLVAINIKKGYKNVNPSHKSTISYINVQKSTDFKPQEMKERKKESKKKRKKES